MKDYFKLRKSKLLLLALLTMIGGVSSAWGQVTESFEDVSTVNADTWGRAGKLSNGWICTNSVGIGTSTDYSYSIWSRAKTGEKSLAGKASSSNSDYMVIPVVVSGDVTFSICCMSTSSSTTGYVKFYRATDNGDGTYTIGSQIGTNFTITGNNSYRWDDKTLSVGDDGTIIAICMYRAAIDDITYTEYVEASCHKPKALNASEVTDESAVLGWTSDATNWNLRYKAEGDADWTAIDGVTDNPYTLTGLDAATNYTFQVQAVCSAEDQSDWSAVGAFTTPLCAPSVQKTISYELKDQYTDGWNGAKITITDVTTGIVIETLTISTGNSASGTVALCPGREYSFVWTKGSYDSECSYTIKDVDGEDLFTHAQGASTTAGEIGKYKWEEEVAVDGAKFKINTDGTTQDFGFAAANEVAEKTFTITNNGNADLVINVTNAADFSVQKVVRFSNSKGWSNVYLYAWNDNGALTAAFPGDKQTNIVGQNEYSQDIYAVEIPAGTTKIIMSNGGDSGKSNDITMDYNKLGLYIDDSNNGVFFGDGYLSVPAGGSTDIKVQMKSATGGVKSGNIVLSFSAVNVDYTSFTIPVTGRVAGPDKYFVNFSGNALPDLWTNGSNSGASWTFANGEAYGQYSSYKNAKMMSPLLTVAEGESLVFQTKGNSSYSDMKVNVYQRDGSTKVKTVDFSTEAREAYSTGEYTMVTLSDLEAGDYKLEFEAYNSYIDNINGFTLNLNDPKMGVYTDGECTVATATSVTKDFAFVTEAPDAAVYYIKNDGTGTMTLAKGADPAGLTVTLDKTAVAAGEHATLTIAMPVADNGGYHGGDVVVTAEGLGSFTVKAQGVVVEEGKLNLNFASDAIPTTWTTGSWSKNASGYVEVGYSSSTMQTSNLVAAAGEQLVVVAKQTYTSSSYSFGVKYKNMDDAEAEWEDLIPSANIGTSYVMLHAAIATAGNYQLQFTGNYTQIQRIYGLSKPDAPEMVVYDGENVAGASYNFGKVTDENDATWTLTVKNEGEAVLTGLAVALSGDNADHYTAVVEDNKTELAKNETATITVTQLKDNLGTHSATLTISATGLDSKEITLSGQTVDHTVLDVDFDTSSAWPSEIIQHGDNWSVYNYNGSGEARQGSTSAATSLTLAPLTVGSTDDKLTFDVAYYNYSSYRELTVSYTTDGGSTWTDYNFGTNEEPVYDLKSNISYSYATQTITGIPAGTVVFKFTGKCIKLDNITGDMKVATAPLVTFTTVENNISGANLKADATATYTLANNGNADYVATVGTTNVTAEVTGDDVTFEAGTLTVPAGKTASITVTMAFAAPYGEKTGNLSITSTSWVGDITDNYTATLVDPTNFVEDFAANARPAGWYSESWTYTTGAARIYTGTAKAMITEKVGAEDGKNVLSFDAKVASGSDEQTLNVYTSTDRKSWSGAQAFTLTAEEQNFKLSTLSDGNYYVKFEAANAIVDNIKGVKKLEAPEHDLYEISTTMAASGTPGASYTATVNAISLRADETVVAELWLEKGGNGTKVAYLENQAMTINTSKTFTLTGNLPTEEGSYEAWITVKNTDNSAYFNTDRIAFTLEHTTSLKASDLVAVASTVQADDNNEFTANLKVTLQNTGSKTLAANEVSVSITDDHTSEANVYTTKTADQYVYVYPGDYTTNNAIIAVWNWSTSEDGEWVATTSMGSGLYIAELKEGKTNFSVVRINPNGTDEDAWKNKWNQSADLSTSAGNVFTFQNWGEGENAKDNFTASAFTLAANETVVLPVSVTGTLTNGEDASYTFNAKENVTNTFYHNNWNVSVSVTAAPTIVLDETDGTVASTGQNRKVTLNRTFVAGWNTICLPFAIAATDIHADAKALAFTDYNDGTKELTFSPVTELEANKPYVIWVENAITEPIEFTGKTVTTSDDPETAFNGVTFQGTYAPMVAGSLDGMWGLTASGKIAKAGASTTMKGFRAYFDGIPATGATARFLDDESTGISSITIDGSAEGVYNLQGQKVEQLHKGGLYIINGKKVVIK